MRPDFRWMLPIAMLLTIGAAADAGQLIVVSDSAADGYARGTILENGAPVKVPASHRLALIDASGKGMTIEGPFDGTLPAAAAAPQSSESVISAMTNIIAQSTRRELAVVRDSGATEASPPDPHYIDVRGDATQCATPDRAVEFWRPPPPRRSALFLTRLSTGEHIQIDWPSSQSTLPWPSSISLVDGETYQVAIEGGLAKSRIVIRILPFADPSLDAAKRLADAGCGRQALALLEAIANAPAGQHAR
jgi:hypothetical protein